MAFSRVPVTSVPLANFADGQVLFGADVNIIVDVFKTAINANGGDIATILSGDRDANVVTTFAALSLIEDPDENDKALVLNDEEEAGQTSLYNFDGTNWVLVYQISIAQMKEQLDGFIDGTTLAGSATQLDDGQNNVVTAARAKQLSDWLNQELLTTSSPTFAAITATTINGTVIELDNKTISWNAVEGTFNVELNTNVTGQMFQELHIYARASVNISEGQVVQFAGTQGSHILVKPANLTEANFNPTLVAGIATESFTANNYGYITWFGKVTGPGVFNAGWAEGQILYVKPGTTTGEMIAETPGNPNALLAPPAYRIQMAAVLNQQNSSQATIMVRPQLGSSLSALTDVDETGVVNGDLLIYNASASKWVRKASGDFVSDTELTNHESQAGYSITTPNKFHYPTDDIVTATTSLWSSSKVSTDLGAKANTSDVFGKADTYSRTQLQTSGQSQVNWGNLTNVPAFADNSWKAPVANEAALPTTGNEDGDLRLVLDTDRVYVFDGPTSTWKLIGASGSGISDHGTLVGLSDDDHTQYFRVDGFRPLTGNLDFNDNQAIDVVIQKQASAPSEVEGKLWYDSAEHILKVYDGTSWLAIKGAGAIVQDLEITATAGQTVFDVGQGGTTSYEVGVNAIEVYKKIGGYYQLKDKDDYTETNTTTITLNTGATAGDEYYFKWYKNVAEVGSVLSDGSVTFAKLSQTVKDSLIAPTTEGTYLKNQNDDWVPSLTFNHSHDFIFREDVNIPGTGWTQNVGSGYWYKDILLTEISIAEADSFTVTLLFDNNTELASVQPFGLYGEVERINNTAIRIKAETEFTATGISARVEVIKAAATIAEVTAGTGYVTDALSTTYDNTTSLLTAVTVQAAIDEVNTEVGTKATVDVYAGTILAAATWTDQTGYFTTDITVSGILSTDKPVVDLDLSAATVAEVADIQAAWGTIYRATTTTDTITFYALEAPTFPEDTDIQIKVVR